MRGRGGAAGQRSGGRGGRGPGLDRETAGVGGVAASVAQHPPLQTTIRLGSGAITLYVACGRCGIVKHLNKQVKKCPIGGCHVCCRCGECRGGGCCLEERRAFFTAMVVDMADYVSEFGVFCRWKGWMRQLGLEKG